MNTAFIMLFFLFLLLQPTFSLLPKALSSSHYKSLCSLNSSFEIIHPYVKCPILEEALKRLRFRMNKEAIPLTNASTAACSIDKLQILIGRGCEENSTHSMWPSATMDEQYVLRIDKGKVAIKSYELWGTLWALETFAQLIFSNHQDSLVVVEQEIMDKPRFLHRGFMIDTSEHYLSMDKIKTFMDAMSMVKMNVLHWHIVDDASFPYVSPTYPNLSAQGAFDPMHLFYTQENIKEILEYARYRGIRVMIEIDSPGHTHSWGKGYPDLLTKCYDGDKPTNRYGPLNPIQNFTYEFIQKLLDEITDLIPDSYLHLGGDKFDYDCWKSNPAIKDFMDIRKFGEDYSKLRSYYISKVHDIVANLAKSKSRNINTVVWEEVFTEGYMGEGELIIHVWKSNSRWSDTFSNATKAGHKVLLSACWYLNYIFYWMEWTNFYGCDPFKFIDNELKHLVIGGEAMMSNVNVDDINLINLSWPRGAIAAEGLWCSHVDSVEYFTPRLNELRCRMLRRGIEAEPITGPGFCMT